MLQVEKRVILISAASTNILFSIKRITDLVNDKFKSSQTLEYPNGISRFTLFLFCIMWYY